MKKLTRLLLLITTMSILFTSASFAAETPAAATEEEAAYSVSVDAAAPALSATTVTLVKGQTKTITVKNTTAKVTWTSGKKSVATVSGGKITAVKKGTATITAKVGKKTLTCKVKVETPKISSTKSSIVAGKTVSLALSGNTQKVTWSSSDKSVATVTSKGVVKGVKAGTATVTAKVASGKKYTCKITVTAPAAKKYGPGKNLKVGKDIPAGQYAVFCNDSTWGGYFEIDKDTSGEFNSIIGNDNFSYNSIITLTKGEYVTLTRCYAVPIESAVIKSNQTSGMLRVGIDIKPGKYKLTQDKDSSFEGYWERRLTDYGKGFDVENVIKNDLFEDSTTITVNAGEYLIFERCTLKKVG